MSQIIYPNYLSNTPDGIDRLKGESHTNIATEVSNIIKNQSSNIQRQVIGLEGNWGSGKSNIVKKIENDLDDKKFFHFVFDTWGHQEDLNRRAILEEIIDFLEIKDDSIINFEWTRKKKQLTGKTINSEKSSFPEIKIFWVLFISSFLAYSFLNIIYPYIEGICSYQGNKVSIIEKLFIIFYLPYLLFIIGLGKLHDEYLAIKNDSENKNLTTNNILGRLFSLIQGKEIKTNTTDFVIENEPSNKIFRDFLDFINERLSENNKTLILTIDNIDRLTTDKIKSLWSTVNIFFADKNDNKYYNNIWLIIPYDESKILKAFKENDDFENEIGHGLIEKTFSVKFRVPPPIPSNWELLFEEKLRTAFGENIIPESEIIFIKRIFDAYTNEIITPRQIINFINDLITLYSINREIKFRYLSLFVVAKSKIINTPTTTILSNNYIEPVKMIFSDDSELQKNISSITFGVPLDMAEEIIYHNEIINIIKNGKVEDIDLLKNNPIAFNHSFYKVFNDLDLSNLSQNSFEKTPLIINKINSLKLIHKDFENKYWKSLKDKFIGLDSTNSYTLEFNNFQKDFYRFNEQYGKVIIEKTINNMSSKIKDTTSENEYINSLNKINEFLKGFENLSLSNLNFSNTISRQLEPENSINLVRQFPENFDKLNLKFSESLISEYYINKEEKLNIELLNSDIDELVKIIDRLKYNFKTIIDELRTSINEMTITNLVELDKFVHCYKLLSNERPFEEITLPKNIYQYIEKYKTDNIDIYIIAICLSLKDMKNNYNVSIIRSLYDNPDLTLVNKISSEIENYISFSDLLKMNINDNISYELLKQIIIKITNNSYGVSSLDITWVLTSFNKILNSVFDEDKIQSKNFYIRLNDWKKYILENLDKSDKFIMKIDLSLIDFATTIKNDLSSILINYSNKFLNNLDKDEIIEIIENRETFTNNLFKKLHAKNKIEVHFLVDKLEPLIFEYLNNFNENDTPLEFKNLLNLKNLFNKINFNKKVKFINDSIKILNKNPKLSSNHIAFYIDFIVENNLLSKINNNFFRQFILSYKFKTYFPNKNYEKKIIDLVSNLKSRELNALIWEKIKRKHSGNETKKYAIKKNLDKK